MVFKLLPALTPSELEGVRARLLVLGGLGRGSEEKRAPGLPRGGEDYLLEGVVFELRRRGLLASKARVPRRMIPGSFNQISQGMQKHLEGFINKRLNTVEKTALGQLAARALADYLEKHSYYKTKEGQWVLRPLSISGMLSGVAKIPAALDEAFPSYLVAGKLPICWRSR